MSKRSKLRLIPSKRGTARGRGIAPRDSKTLTKYLQPNLRDKTGT